MAVEIEDIQSCPECENSSTVRDELHGELICDNCGLVLDEALIDPGQDWNAYNPEDYRKKCRTGSPMTYTLNDKGLSTEISWADKDINGRALSRRSRTEFHRLRRVNRRSKAPTTSEQNIIRALTELRKCAFTLGLPQALSESSALIYRRAHNMKLTRGRTIKQICAASVYAACRQHQLPRTLDEVAKAFGLKKREVGRGFNCIVKELGLALERNSVYSYISRYCDELRLNNGTPARVRELVTLAEEAGVVDGKSPLAVIGAAIYIASYETGHPRTQAEVSAVTGISEVTIRNRYKEMSGKLGISLDNIPGKKVKGDAGAGEGQGEPGPGKPVDPGEEDALTGDAPALEDATEESEEEWSTEAA
jgi:transcription initiation factor TFIIB